MSVLGGGLGRTPLFWETRLGSRRFQVLQRFTIVLYDMGGSPLQMDGVELGTRWVGLGTPTGRSCLLPKHAANWWSVAVKARVTAVAGAPKKKLTSAAQKVVAVSQCINCVVNWDLCAVDSHNLFTSSFDQYYVHYNYVYCSLLCPKVSSYTVYICILIR